jgi:hypothetical protein
VEDIRGFQASVRVRYTSQSSHLQSACMRHSFFVSLLHRPSTIVDNSTTDKRETLLFTPSLIDRTSKSNTRNILGRKIDLSTFQPISKKTQGKMDLLKSLNLEDLPEQQTRLSQLTESQPDFQLNLGFDACCSCGKTSPAVECQGCHRVKYCSKACQENDAAPPHDEMEQALGHSSVICAVLRLCNDDEAIEESKASSLDNSKKAAAIDRLASEFESYPATLANILLDGPCYQDALHKCNGDSLTIHVVGASFDSELWSGHPDPAQERNVFKGYAEALGEIAENHKLKTILLHFVGPECPTKDVQETLTIPPVHKASSSSTLLVRTHCANYDSTLVKGQNISSPEIVIFFNPGFTCPDYEWDEALACIEKGTPFLLTTNTELEGVADAQYLLDRDLMGEMPIGLAEILGNEDEPMGDAHAVTDGFFSVNPFCGSRVRQSGTMGNDLYVKSRWMLGGTLGSSAATTDNSKTSKKQKIEGSGNSKKANPALV